MVWKAHIISFVKLCHPSQTCDARETIENTIIYYGIPAYLQPTWHIAIYFYLDIG